MDLTQNGLNSEWTELGMDSTPNGLNPKWTQPQLGLNPEWTELRMGLNLVFLSTLNGTISPSKYRILLFSFNMNQGVYIKRMDVTREYNNIF